LCVYLTCLQVKTLAMAETEAAAAILGKAERLIKSLAEQRQQQRQREVRQRLRAACSSWYLLQQQTCSICNGNFTLAAASSACIQSLLPSCAKYALVAASHAVFLWCCRLRVRVCRLLQLQQLLPATARLRQRCERKWQTCR
jgi:hypothetical protein